MIKVGIFDGSSCLPGQSSGSYCQETANWRPLHIEWVERQYLPVTFYTDLLLEHVYNAPPGTVNVAWLIEPTSISDTHYHKAIGLQDKFDFILSHDDYMFDHIEQKRFRFYPFGGLFVEPRNVPLGDKTKLVSMILSPKLTAPGHKFRHEIAEAIKDLGIVDLYGPEFIPLPTKSPALASYMYSIVVEPIKNNEFFSEKLIDCFALNTIPIYWGCNLASMFFHPQGIVNFDSIEQLKEMVLGLVNVGDLLYKDRITQIACNRAAARNYYCREDWIYENIPEIFKAKA